VNQDAPEDQHESGRAGEEEREGNGRDDRRQNQGWVRFLAVLVGLVTVIAVISTWADRQLFDTDEWGSTSVEMLEDPVIRETVADYAVSELYANVDVEAELRSVLPGDTRELSGILAGALRRLADQGAQQALDDRTVQNVWRQANETAHQALVAIIEDDTDVAETSDGVVRLDLRQLIIEVAGQIGLADQAETIPEGVGEVEVLESEELSEAQTAARVIRGTALISSLLLVLLAGLTIYLAPGYRWLSMLWVAVALVVAAIVVLILRSVGGEIVTRELAEPDVQPAALAAWNIGTDLLTSIVWTVIAAAAIIAALGWLISPNSAADSTRGALAVPFVYYPWAVGIVLGLLAFLFLADAVGDGRDFLMRLLIVLLAGAGAFFFRRHLAEEYPDATPEKFRDFGGQVSDRTSEIGGRVKDAASDVGERVRDTASGVKEKASDAWDKRPDATKPDSSGEGESAGDREAGHESRGAVTDDRPAPDVEESLAAPTESAPIQGVGPGASGGESSDIELLEDLRRRGVISDEALAAEKARRRNG
jgi:hypothetical protein